MRISDWSSDVCSSDLDYHLKIDGIEGESLDEKHKGEIEIDSFSWGVTNMGGGGRGGGGGTGKAEFSDINFSKRSEEHTSELQSLMRISYAVFCSTQKTTPSSDDDHAPTLQAPSTD